MNEITYHFRVSITTYAIMKYTDNGKITLLTVATNPKHFEYSQKLVNDLKSASTDWVILFSGDEIWKVKEQ